MRSAAGMGYIFAPVQTLLPFLESTQRLNFGFTWGRSSRSGLDETLIYSRLGTRPGTVAPPFSAGQSVFNNYLNRAKLNYQFTKELSLRLILDYNATIANAQLFDVQRSLGGSDDPNGPFAPTKQFTTDVLFTYLLHPGTAVYVGYNNGYTDLTLRGLPPSVNVQGAPNNSTSTLFSINFSYLFLFNQNPHSPFSLPP